jgi:hypothetical protein
MSTDFLKSAAVITLYSDSAAGLTVTGPGSAADIGLVLRAIIDRSNAETVGPKLSYDVAGIPLMGQDVLYSTNIKSYREAFDKIISMYAGYSFWYVDEYGVVRIKTKPATPTHTFELSTQVKNIKIQRSLEKLRNFLIIWNGEAVGSDSLVFKHYQDDASILQFGRRADYMQDNGIGDEATADKIGANYLAQNKDPDITATVEIIDNNYDVNGYDIESIQPGDTCRFVGFNASNANYFYDNMLITKVDYQLDRVVLTIEMTKSDIINWQDKTAKEVNDLRSQGSPDTYS